MYTYEYPRPMVTADAVVVGHRSDGTHHLLLVQRGHDPFQGHWALPGGFMEMDETLEQCARRELAEETGLHLDGPLHEIKSFSDPGRDPRGRTITVAFLALVDLDRLPPVQGGDDAAQARWFPLKELPPLAFDHDAIVHEALKGMGDQCLHTS